MTDPIEILLVEDNPNDVKLTLNAFARHKLGNLILVARDGVEALDFVFCRGEHAGRDINQPPKLILLDLKLPKVDGLEVLRVIKADPRTQMIPVVVLTSSTVDTDIQESYLRGANSYIVKPVDFDKFIEAAYTLGLYWLQLNHPPVIAPVEAAVAK